MKLTEILSKPVDDWMIETDWTWDQEVVGFNPSLDSSHLLFMSLTLRMVDCI